VSVQTLLSATRLLKLVGFTVKLFDKTTATPTRQCFWCGKETKHVTVRIPAGEIASCTACKFTQPLGSLSWPIVEKGGLSPLEHLIITAHKNSADASQSILVRSTEISFRSAMMSLSYICTQPEFKRDKVFYETWLSFEFLALLFAHRTESQALQLLELCRQSQTGEEVSAVWHDWQTPNLKAWYSGFLKTPDGLPRSMPGLFALVYLQETSESDASDLVKWAVTRDAGWWPLALSLVMYTESLLRKT